MPKNNTISWVLTSDFIFEGFAPLPHRYGDALYCLDPGKVDCLVFDIGLGNYPAAQVVLRGYLLTKVAWLRRESYWATLGPWRLYIRLSDLGYNVADFLPSIVEPLALPAPEECRRIGYDETPTNGLVAQVVSGS